MQITNVDTLKTNTEQLGLISGLLEALNDVLGGQLDQRDYRSVSVQVSGTFVGTVTFEVSNDNITWRGKTLQSASNSSNGSTTSGEIFQGDIGARYFRVRMSAWTSGAAKIDIQFSPESIAAFSNQMTIAAVTPVINAAINATQANGVLSTTNLGVSATYTGTTQDMGSTASAHSNRVKPVVRHLAGLVPGSLILQESIDGTTWIETRRVPVPSDGLYHSFDWALHYRYYRLLFTNGATAQTGFHIGYSTTRGDGSSIDIKNVITFPETVAGGVAIAASGSLVGSTLDLGGNHDWQTVRASMVGTAVAATLRIEQSWDGTNWFLDNGASVAYGTSSVLVTVESKIVARYVRSRILAGANAYTDARLFTTLVSI